MPRIFPPATEALDRISRLPRWSVAALLVLAMLLLSVASAPKPLLPQLRGPAGGEASLLIAAADRCATPPDCQDDIGHCPPCCIGSQCQSQPYGWPADSAKLPYRSDAAIASSRPSQAALSGFAMPPSLPPPRATV